MKINLNITLSDTEVRFLKEAKNIRALKSRVKKITGIYSKTIYGYLEDNCNTENLIKCGFCGSLKAFKHFTYITENNNLYLSFEYPNETKICNRRTEDLGFICGSKNLNPNSIEYVKVAYDMTHEEANNYILERNSTPFYRNNHESDEAYKKYQSRDADFYGIEKYEAILQKISESSCFDGLIKRHGYEKAKEICKSKDSTSKELFKARYGDEWEEKFNERVMKTKGSLESFILRHGEELGTKKFNEFREKSSVNAHNFNSKLSDIEKVLLFGTCSKLYHKNKYGDDWENTYKEQIKKVSTQSSKASKESLKFFNKLIDKIEHLGLEYFIGVEGNREWFIYDNDSKKINLYDFCIKELKIIIEFHGSLWHYNPDNLFEDRERPYGLQTELLKNADEYKRNLALSNNFEYFVVFDTDNYDIMSDILSGLIIEKYKKVIKNE